MVPVPQVCPILSLPGHTMHVYVPLDDMWKTFPHFVQFPLPPPNFNVLCAGMSFWMPSGFRGCQVDILYLTCHSKTVGTFRFPPHPHPPLPHSTLNHLACGVAQAVVLAKKLHGYNNL